MKKNKSIRHKIYHFLLYLTNNLPISKHEKEWDIAFFILEFFAGIGGMIYFIIKHEIGWCLVILIETCWSIDNLRTNRVENEEDRK